MAHPQNSFRGLFAKTRIDMGSNQITHNSTGLLLNAGVRLSGQANAFLTGDSTGLVVAGGVKVSNKRAVTANSTGFALTAESTIPTTNEAGAMFSIVSNSTGQALVVNSTAATWKYLNVTSKQPT